MKTNWLTEIVKEKFAATNDDLNFSQLTPFIFRKMLEAGITSKSKVPSLVMANTPTTELPKRTKGLPH